MRPLYLTVQHQKEMETDETNRNRRRTEPNTYRKKMCIVARALGATAVKHFEINKTKQHVLVDQLRAESSISTTIISRRRTNLSTYSTLSFNNFSVIFRALVVYIEFSMTTINWTKKITQIIKFVYKQFRCLIFGFISIRLYFFGHKFIADSVPFRSLWFLFIELYLRWHNSVITIFYYSITRFTSFSEPTSTFFACDIQNIEFFFSSMNDVTVWISFENVIKQRGFLARGQLTFWNRLRFTYFRSSKKSLSRCKF